MYTFEDILKQKAGILKCREEHIETCSDCDDNFRCTLQMKHIEFEEAQQQEIDRLTYENRQLKAAMSEIFNSEPVDYHNPADTELIDALISDKDEQAGRIMQLDSGLKKLRASLQWLKETIRDLDYKAWAEDNIGKIDALLGGAEDAE